MSGGTSRSTVSLVAVVEDETCLRAATVLRRHQRMVHVELAEALALPTGAVVGLVGPDDVAPTLAVVSERVAPTVMALRLVERRS